MWQSDQGRSRCKQRVLPDRVFKYYVIGSNNKYGALKNASIEDLTKKANAYLTFSFPWPKLIWSGKTASTIEIDPNLVLRNFNSTFNSFWSSPVLSSSFILKTSISYRLSYGLSRFKSLHIFLNILVWWSFYFFQTCFLENILSLYV